MRLSRFLLPIVLVFSMMAAGCSSLRLAGQEMETRQIFAMDTIMTLSAYGPNAADALTNAAAEINRLDQLLSTNNPQSDVAKLNDTGCATLSPEASELLTRSQELYEQTGGAFDCAIYPIVKAWGFTTGSYRVPSKEEIAVLLPLCDPSQITLTGQQATMSKGMAIDFGGIAKGYTSQRVIELFRQTGISHAIISLGGNVQTLGTKPDGSAWQVAVQYMDQSDEYAIILQLEDEAAVTSGSYQRYFEQDGKRYHHILDPHTGFPAESGLLSVTVLCGEAARADALSTACFVLGADRGWELIESLPGVEALFVREDGTQRRTSGFPAE